MYLKKIAEKMKAAKYSSDDLTHCLIAQNYLCELLLDRTLDKVQQLMVELEEEQLDAQRGKPTSLAEYKELIGEN